MVKVWLGAKMVLSAIDWATHWAWLKVPAFGVPLDRAVVALGDGLFVSVGVEVGMFVAEGFGKGVTEGVKASTWVTCDSTVAAISVRKGFRSRVGVLVVSAGLQAAIHKRFNNTPIRRKVLFL